MKKSLLTVLLVAGSVAVCAAQRHPYGSRPYHPPDRPSMPREARRQQPPPANVNAPKPQPVSVPQPKQDVAKRK